jgi:hypothetical protein
MTALRPPATDELSRPIEGDDEYNHQPHGERNWRENCWLTFFDHTNGLRGVVYQNLQPELGQALVLVMLYHRTRPLLVVRDTAVPWTACSHEERRAGPTQFECLEPLDRWRVHVEHGDVTLDLTWQALYPAYDWGWGPIMRARHYEQAVRVEGRLVAGDESWDVQGLGQRDHAWGHREPHAISDVWSSRVFFSEQDNQHTTIANVRGEQFLFGYTIRDGKPRLFDRMALRTLAAHSGGPPLCTELRGWSGDELVLDQQARLETVVGFLGFAETGENRQFFTFSDFSDGAGLAAVGQLDAWWAAPLSADTYRTCEVNRGSWVET